MTKKEPSKVTKEPSTLDYLCAKIWMQKTDRWQEDYHAQKDGLEIYFGACELYYKASPEDQVLWKRIHEVNDNEG